MIHREGEERRAEERWRERGRSEEEEAAAAADSLYQPAAAGAGGHFPEEPVPGHEHQRRNSRVDKPDRGQSPGKWHQKPVEGRASTRGRVSVKTALVQKLDQRVVIEYLKYVYFFLHKLSL